MEDITRVLGEGKLNAKHLEEVAQELMTTPRKAKQIIREARMQGACIVSSAKGYWIANDEQEMSIYRDTMRKQAYSRLKTIKPINRALKQIGGQISLKELLEASEEGTASEQA